MKDNAVQEYLGSLKSERTKVEYVDRFQVWLEYCKMKVYPIRESEQLENTKNRECLDNKSSDPVIYESLLS